MKTNADLSREIGTCITRLDGQDDKLKTLEEKMDRVLGYMERNKGGLKMLFTLGTIASAIGAGLMAVWSYLHPPGH